MNLRRSILAAIAAVLFVSSSAFAVSSGLVISQIYGAGGNTGATFTNDFVELFNRGNSPVSLSGLSVQYASATGTGNLGITNQITVLPAVTLNPGQYYLIQEAGGPAGAPLPVPADFAVTTGAINMSGSAGKVALVSSTTSIGCNGGSTPCSPAQQALIIDLIGYGSANFFEGASAPTLTATTAAIRGNGGCTDTDNNASDFSAATPAPRNSASSLHPCGVVVNNPPVINAPANPITNVTQNAPAFNVGLTGTDDGGVFNWSATAGTGISSVTVNSGQGTSSVSYRVTLQSGFAGTATFTASLSDNVNAAVTQTVNILVNAINNPPAITPPANPITSVPQNSAPFTVSLTGSDDGGVYNWSASTGTGVAAVSVTGGQGTATATFTVTLQNGFNGGASFTATLSDNVNPAVSQLVNISVQQPPPTTVKISQVYGGGGNSGATYTNDFIELFNEGTTPVSLDGWSVQATAATGTSWTQNGPPTPLSGTIQPGHYYLIQESAGTGGTTGLPAPDATGTLTLSATNAKIALVASTSPLTGGCPVGVNIVDFIGYGTATCSETSPTPPLTNTTAAIRKGNGCIDTDNNANDFFVRGGPIPRNSSSPANSCGGDPTQISAVGSANPNALEPAANTLLTVAVTPATMPPSSGISVTADLTSIGGVASQGFSDTGGNTFSFEANIGAFTTTGVKNIVATISDAQGRTATAPITLTVVSPTCGVERWSIKVGVDDDATMVHLESPVHTSISDLADPTKYPAPPDPPGPPVDHRVLPAETTVFVVNATLTLFKKETDVDYHIVLQDDAGKTMVTEIPSPACIITSTTPRVPAFSPFATQISSARSKFDAHFTPSSLFQMANVPVQVTGVAFFDFIHGQTGVAPNGIELHPILDISFTSPSTTTIASAPSPSQYQQQVTLTSTVANSGGTTPTGQVTFTDGTTTVGTANLVNGVATRTTTLPNIAGTGSPVGTHMLMASYGGDSTSATSHSGGLTHVVNRADQTIDFGPLADKTYGDADFTVSAASSSGLSVSFAVVSGPVTVTGNTVHITGAGYVVLRASQGGDGNFNQAPDATQAFNVLKANQTITFNPLPDKTYGDPPFTLSATGGGSGNAVTFSATGNCTASGVNGSTITITGGGSCTVTASQAGDANYNDSSLPRSFKINKATATINVNGFSGLYDGKPHGATGSAHGVFGEDLSSLLNLGATFTNVPGGLALWSFSGNSNYADAGGSATIDIQRATPVIVLGNASPTFDGATHGTTATALGVNGAAVAGSFTFTYNNSAAMPVSAGTYAVGVAFSSADSNYADTTGSGSFTIRQATPVVTVSGGPFVFDGQPKSASAVASYKLADGTTVTVSGTFAFTYTPAPPVNPGTYGVTAAFTSGDANYGNTSGTGAIVISGLRDDLQDQANALAKLRNAATSRQDLDRLNNAIGHLGEALDPDVWLDSIHGTAANGDEIFAETKNAAISILALLNDPSSTVSKADLRQILSRIVIDDRMVAQTAINDAVARGGNAHNIDKARSELSSSDSDIAAGHYESALEHDRNAWSFATKA